MVVLYTEEVEINGIRIYYDELNTRVVITDGTYTVYLPMSASGTVTSA